MITAIPEVTLYFKEGCDLCECVDQELQDFIQRQGSRFPFNLKRADIEDSKEWFDLYHLKVPVICVDGKEVFHYHFDEEKFIDALQC